MTCKIKHVTHPYASETMMARRDYAHTTGSPLWRGPDRLI
jgi:hypothetical protein